MFDIGYTELLLIAIVALIVFGPKELPHLLRQMGRIMGRVRSVAGHFRSGVDAMIRESEMEEMQKKWAAQNQAIMAAHPAPQAEAAPQTPAPDMSGAPPAPESDATAPPKPS